MSVLIERLQSAKLGRKTVAHMSEKNLMHNLKVINKYACSSGIIAMVKANSYGHGIRSIAKRLKGNVAKFGVASINEAIALREVGIDTPIILMEGVYSSEEMLLASTYSFSVVFNNYEQIKWMQELKCSLVDVWLKIDTGMGRLGFAYQEAEKAYSVLSGIKSINGKVGIMSHFSCADDKDHFLNDLQIERFSALKRKLKVHASLCNSAGIFNFMDYHYEYVRPGISLFGISPCVGKKGSDYGLLPVMTLKSQIISIKKCKKGDYIGYGAKYCCDKDINMAIVSCGYGDGYPRGLFNFPVVIRGKICYKIGQLSMDMMSVDLAGCKDAKVGDEVILWGEGLAIEEIAKINGRSCYEMLTGVQHRVQFIWDK